MTTQANIPAKWYVPFAQGDASRVELPVTTADPTRASQTLGFPPLTMQPPESGGVPPQGEDFNGGMNQIARVAWWVLNGGGWPYDAAFATNSNINGYPNGAKLQSADFRGDWINTTDGNQNNPDTVGTNWVPGFQYGITALTGLTGGTVTPTPAQAAKNTITLAGTLTSALTVVLPTWLKSWTIINSTTGAFVTIVKTAAGSGVTIPQDSSRTAVTGDGTNIVANAPSNSPGRLLRTTVFSRVSFNGAQQVAVNGGAPTTTGASTFTALPGTNFIIVEAAGGGGGSGATATTSQVSLTGGGGGGAYVKAQYNANFASLAITVGAGGTGGTTGGNGGNGGTTSVGALATVPGGSGSAGNTTITTGQTGIATGGVAALSPTGSGFLVWGQGKQGRFAITTQAGQTLGGDGADSPFGGGGGVGSGTGQPGNPGVGYGSGAGGVSVLNAASVAGQNGQAGIVIISEYA